MQGIAQYLQAFSGEKRRSALSREVASRLGILVEFKENGRTLLVNTKFTYAQAVPSMSSRAEETDVAAHSERGPGDGSSSPVKRGDPLLSPDQAERIMEEAVEEAVIVRRAQLAVKWRQTFAKDNEYAAEDILAVSRQLPFTREGLASLTCETMKEILAEEMSWRSLVVTLLTRWGNHTILLFVNGDQVWVMDATLQQYTDKSENYFGRLEDYLCYSGFYEQPSPSRDIQAWAVAKTGAEKFRRYLEELEAATEGQLAVGGEESKRDSSLTTGNPGIEFPGIPAATWPPRLSREEEDSSLESGLLICIGQSP